MAVRNLTKTEIDKLEPLLQRQEEAGAWADVLQRRLLRKYEQPTRYSIRTDRKFQKPDGEVVEGVQMDESDFDQMMDARDEKNYWDSEVQNELVALKKACEVPFGSQIVINGWKWNGPDGQPVVKKEKQEAKEKKTKASRAAKKGKKPSAKKTAGDASDGAGATVTPLSAGGKR